jgi:hypothetical protein
MFDSPSSSGTVANQACVRAGMEMKFTGGREGLMGAVGNGQVLLHKTSHMLHLDCLRDGTCAMLLCCHVYYTVLLGGGKGKGKGKGRGKVGNAISRSFSG